MALRKTFFRNWRKIQSPEGVTLIPLDKNTDARGVLIVGEVASHVPFEIKRFFFVSGAPSGTRRGKHGHLKCHQLMIAVSGTVTVEVSDGATTDAHVLDRPDRGLFIPPLVWGVQCYHSTDSLLLVLCSHAYDRDDYFGDAADIKMLKRSSRSHTRLPGFTDSSSLANGPQPGQS